MERQEVPNRVHVLQNLVWLISPEFEQTHSKEEIDYQHRFNRLHDRFRFVHGERGKRKVSSTRFNVTLSPRLPFYLFWPALLDYYRVKEIK